MKTFQRFAQCLLGLTLPLFAVTAFAQEKYPSRPIEMIVPWGAGGGSDQTGRMIANLLEQELKVSVPVVNVPGGTGNTGMTKLLSAPADGYSMAILAWDSFATLATQSPKWSMDDFTPLAVVIQLPSGLYVAGDKYPDWKAVEAAAKQRPLKVAISGFGSPDEITINFMINKGLKLTAVPFAKPGERYSALLGGHVDLLYSPSGNVTSFVESKQMRPVIFLHSERLPEFPAVPTSPEMGYDISLPQRRAVIIKAGTDPQRVKMLGDAIARVAASPKYKEYLQKSFASENSFVPTKEALELMKRDLDNMKKIVAAAPKK
ncbi:MAG TPA: tripartite tricarboxylate transporter substrate binding protein [Usitatibacter sp.]|nr:tripartite tricarboxylate transporter substrate binding protein [Usitatibacter sp.]